ncbi:MULTISPECIES: glycoside hydrolase family 88 protein [unclassified Arenibacter]|uniref:glycoside hydrolase family 88 protein n=1 Tax=unclassified Arenibacter TaxID=2615047 RepID=UPI000E34202E|nr:MULTISPECIES: glycoside hydrolase family 88 protein [unclassified Arenibacter]MCM4164587.1 glucuronyl hydrolase [Arenibacter sp. A80]RFT55670.1 glucuronyl hydrolase [Arenibacter sp. P308M17]
MKIKIKYSLFTSVLLLVVSASLGQQQEYASWTLEEVQEAIDHCKVKTERTIVNLEGYDKSPRTIPADSKHWEAKPTGGWTSGFWAGILWYVYEGTGSEKIKIEAEKFTNEIETILSVPVKSHDLGFIFQCSYGNGYRLTKNGAYKKTLLIAADSLSHLYNPSVGTILSWPAQVSNKVFSPHNTIIDNMMNLELLFEASKLSTNKKYYKMAVSHANVTAKNQVRPNNTVYHVLIYDDRTGKALRKATHQGFSDESVWARGQGWGIYGYAMGYRETANRKYLKIADKLAKAYLKRLSKDYVPFWDFDDPAIPNTPKDASAASIVASAFLELSELHNKRAKKELYRTWAEKMLRSLSSPSYLSGSRNDAFLIHSTGNKPRNREVDIPIIYADYYYIEALVRLKKILQSEMAGKQMPKR